MRAAAPHLLASLQARQPLLWTNPRRVPAPQALARLSAHPSLGRDAIVAADRLLRSWAPALQQLFPELAAGAGLIESPLYPLAHADAVTGVPVPGPALIKADHALPVAGSIKARGGIYEVLAHAQDLAQRGGLLAADGDPRVLLGALSCSF